MEKKAKVRLDCLAYQKGLFPSKEKARRAILSGQVLVGGTIVDKPGKQVGSESLLTVKEKDRFVSRGGIKLEAAIKHFQLTVKDNIGLDIGASTGGFTDCLLQNGAARIYAVDVGYGQLDWSLRNNPRVVVMEKVNARHLDASAFTDEIDIITADVSFISLEKILPALITILKPGGDLVCLIKPQFETQPKNIKRGGVVKDPAVHEAVLSRLRNCVAQSGMETIGVIPSPIMGPAGNREFLMYCSKKRC